MIKITTLFKKNPENLGRVINEINSENEWVFTDEGVKATRKFDGTAAAIINGELYKRYDVKKGRQVPSNAIACQEPDPITGHWPHWVKCDRNNKEDRYFWEGFDNLLYSTVGAMALLQEGTLNSTYELCGPKVQGNPENLTGHHLIKHGDQDLFFALRMKKANGEMLYAFDYIKQILTKEDIEGIVFHHPDGRMCKIRKSDFGIKRTTS